MFISRRHSSIDFTSCFSATSASLVNFGRLLLPNPLMISFILTNVYLSQKRNETNLICRLRKLDDKQLTSPNSLPKVQRQLPSRATSPRVYLMIPSSSKSSISYLLFQRLDRCRHTCLCMAFSRLETEWVYQSSSFSNDNE